jgi:hypothetical protein
MLVRRDPESRKIAKNQIILEPPPLLAGDDELQDSLLRGYVGPLKLYHFKKREIEVPPLFE